ncbi:similar to spore coat protein [Planococcus glaciei]|uniref:spore coat protein n=1 Tax=Planococcus glaciei TaxID=459472 RepID=UPI0008858E60|nr:similar to spore coat protein [Planococcus glaciei]
MANQNEQKKTETEAINKENLAIPGSMLDDLAIATDFLVTAKAAVRNLAVAITETATPQVKKLLRRELDIAIDTHDKIAQYMIKNEMYHAYDVNEQVQHDLKKADITLELAKKK